MADNLKLNISFEHKIPLEIVRVSEKSHGIILGLHGYAHMAENMQEPLSFLAGDKYDYCSLQAPHVFTTPNNSYVSTWMNRINRDLYIDYQIQYFNSLAYQLGGYQNSNSIKIGFGFSQGASSLYRMAFLSKLKLDVAVIFAGDIPPEIKDMASGKINSLSTKFILVHGANDTIMPKEKILEDFNWLQLNKIEVELINYDGRHAINSEALESISTYMENLF